jgi:hypothetical protein
MENNTEEGWNHKDSVRLYIAMLIVVTIGTIITGAAGISTTAATVAMMILISLLVIHGIIAGEFSNRMITVLVPLLIIVAAGVVIFYTISRSDAEFVHMLILAFVLTNKIIYYINRR